MKLSLGLSPRDYSVAAGVTYDADALAYFTANTAITSTADKNAINTFYLGLKSDGIYTKIKAMYLPIWGSAAACKWNLVNPLDTNAAFRLTFTVGITYSSSGILFNGASSYALTYIDLNAILGTSSPHLSLYGQNNANTGLDQIDIGVLDFNTNYCWLSDWYNASGYSNVLSRNTSVSVLLNGGSTTTSKGFFITSKVSTTAKIYKNGSILTSATDNGNNPGNYGPVIGALNNQGTIQYFTNRSFSFISIGSGLTDAQASNLSSRVNTLMTYFGINVY